MPPWCGTAEEAELLTDYLDENQTARLRRGSICGDPAAAKAEKTTGGWNDGPDNAVEHATAGTPAPIWFVQFFKVLGFTLHVVPMNLWYAGLLVALLLRFRGGEQGGDFGGRLLRQMPVIVAFGVNLGIVPLLFIQTAYYHVFYPATILMAWFWLAIIALLIPAYYGVYVYAWGLRKSSDKLPAWRIAAGWCSMVLFLTIGFLFANGLSLMADVERWHGLWKRSQRGWRGWGTALNVGDRDALAPLAVDVRSGPANHGRLVRFRRCMAGRQNRGRRLSPLGLEIRKNTLHHRSDLGRRGRFVVCVRGVAGGTAQNDVRLAAHAADGCDGDRLRTALAADLLGPKDAVDGPTGGLRPIRRVGHQCRQPASRAEPEPQAVLGRVLVAGGRAMGTVGDVFGRVRRRRGSRDLDARPDQKMPCRTAAKCIAGGLVLLGR